jgi:hypothetical protein
LLAVSDRILVFGGCRFGGQVCTGLHVSNAKDRGTMIRTRGEETRVEVILIFPAVMGGSWVGYLIARVASTTFHSATNAIVHSENQLHNASESLSLQLDLPAD